MAEQNAGSKPKPRRWSEQYIPLLHPEFGMIGHDREQMREALVEIEAFLYRQGGAAIIVADRVRHEDGSFETVGLNFQYESYAPARNAGPGEFVGGGAIEPVVEAQDRVNGDFEPQPAVLEGADEVFEDDAPPVSATAGVQV